MNVKEYLGQAYLLDRRIESGMEELEGLRQMAQAISSPGFEEHYNATKNTDAPYARTVENLYEQEQNVMRDISIQTALKAQIHEVIEQVDRPEYQMVLRYRYIHNYSWTKIGELLKADTTTVQRWNNKATAKICLPEDAIILKK